MIDITPLDVRKKKGDFPRSLRGYDPGEVDTFLELVADRLEEVVKKAAQLQEEVEDLRVRVERGEGREQAVQEALVMAQELREEIRNHARKEAELIKREAEEAVEQIRARAETLMAERRKALQEVDRTRGKALRGLRRFLEQELDAVADEEARAFSVDLEGVEVPKLVGDAAGEARIAKQEDRPEGGGEGEAGGFEGPEESGEQATTEPESAR